MNTARLNQGTPLLLNAVSKHYAENIVLNQLDLHIPAGQFVAVVGAVGSGKSALAQALLDSPHDLIRKAVGWLLREVGKRDEPLLLRFLHEHERYRVMPRVMLRYAIERLPPQTRHLILHGMPFPVEKE